MIRPLLLSLLFVGALTAAEIRAWQTVRGQTIEGSLLKQDGENVIIQRKNSSEKVTVPREELLPPDILYLKNLGNKPAPAPAPGGFTKPSPTKPASPGPTPFKPTPSSSSSTSTNSSTAPQGSGDDGDEVAGEPAKGRLYPRTKEEIRTGLHAILQRDKPKSLANKEVHEAICRLNAYRFLSGLYDEVGTEPSMVEGADDAAKACAKEGTISHSLGHSTNRCNLSMGQHDMASTVDGYIGDGGDNNRERRGHRRWCLNPPMANAGFGRDGIFSAMWCMDSGGKKAHDPWSYPGRGLYPLDYVKGNAWSFYNTSNLPDDTKVRIWKLTARPTQAIPWGEEPKGREIAVDYSFVYDNTINFEPDSKIRGKRGIYWVRVHGRGVREQYLTELF